MPFAQAPPPGWKGPRDVIPKNRSAGNRYPGGSPCGYTGNASSGYGYSGNSSSGYGYTGNASSGNSGNSGLGFSGDRASRNSYPENRRPKFSRLLLPLLALVLFAASRTGPGRDFLSHAGAAAADLPIVSRWLSAADGAVPEADGTVPEADGAVPEADGAVPEADGTVPEADGAVPEADGTVPEADGTVPEADGAVPPALPAREREDSPGTEGGGETVPASDAADAAADTGQVFPLNYSPCYPQSVRFDGDSLTLHGLPDEPEYGYVMLCVESPGGEEAFKEMVPRSPDGSAAFVLSSVGEGDAWRLRMYANMEQYGRYTSFLELSAQKARSGWSFLPSPVQDANARFARDSGTSQAALAYYLRPSRNIQSDDAPIREAAAQIVSGLAEPYEKALAIHDWVSANLYYDQDVFTGRAESGDSSAAGTLRSRRGVCEGYANLACALLRAAGIPAKVVSGYALGISGGDAFPAEILSGGGEANHAWNEAYVNGRWLLLDTTWDSGNKYERGRITESGGCISRRYFDISREYLAQDHAVMDSNNYREITLYEGSSRMETARGLVSLDGPVPATRDGHLTAPLEPIIQEMGGTCQWDRRPGYYDRLECRVNGHYVQLWPTQADLLVDNFYGEEAKELSFDVLPQVVDGYTVVQLDALLTAIDCAVERDSAKGGVVIGYTT